jgi:hypothetical protein
MGDSSARANVAVQFRGSGCVFSIVMSIVLTIVLNLLVRSCSG